MKKLTDRARMLVWRTLVQRRRRAERDQREKTMELQQAYHDDKLGAPSHDRVDANKRKLRRIRESVASAEAALAKIRTAIAAKSNPGQRALDAAGQWLGRTERGNRAPWLDSWARQYVGPWMVGQPWCGLLCIVAWASAGVSLPKDTVSTVAILNRARRGDQFTAVSPESARAGDLVVMDFDRAHGPPAMHVGLAKGPMRNGLIPTREGNTSPGSGGSQNDGGGVYDRVRPRNVVVVVARPKGSA
jgi:hypothetical protein